MPVECERIQGFPDDWTFPSKPILDIDRTDSMRYHALGNAVTVNVAEWLARRIAGYLLKRPAVNDAMHVLNGSAPYNGNGACGSNGNAASSASPSKARKRGLGRLAGSPGKR
jgi:DNA (cytosine-5)-methyltransferase 1